MSRFWKIALVVVVVLVLAVVGLRLMHKPGGQPGQANAQGQGEEGKQPPVPVTVVPVARQDVPVYLTALGTVQALNTVAISQLNWRMKLWSDLVMEPLTQVTPSNQWTCRQALGLAGAGQTSRRL